MRAQFLEHQFVPGRSGGRLADDPAAHHLADQVVQRAPAGRSLADAAIEHSEVHRAAVVRQGADPGVLPEPRGDLAVGRVVEGVGEVAPRRVVDVFQIVVGGDHAGAQGQQGLIVDGVPLGVPLADAGGGPGVDHLVRQGALQRLGILRRFAPGQQERVGQGRAAAGVDRIVAQDHPVGRLGGVLEETAHPAVQLVGPYHKRARVEGRIAQPGGGEPRRLHRFGNPPHRSGHEQGRGQPSDRAGRHLHIALAVAGHGRGVWPQRLQVPTDRDAVWGGRFRQEQKGVSHAGDSAAFGAQAIRRTRAAAGRRVVDRRTVADCKVALDRAASDPVARVGDSDWIVTDA